MDYDYDLDYGDLQEDHDSYYYESEDDENALSKMTIDQVYSLCLKPTIYETVKSISYVFLWCFVYRCLGQSYWINNWHIGNNLMFYYRLFSILDCLCGLLKNPVSVVTLSVF